MIITDCLPAVMTRLGGTYSGNAVSIGCVVNDELVAGVIYDRYNGVSLYISIWVGSRPSPEFMHAIFDYPFNQIGARKVIGLIYGTNEKSIRLAEHAGFTLEGVIKDCCEEGDMFIYTMTPEQCRFLAPRRAA